MLEYFPGQKPDEQVKVLVRPHWLVLLASILFLIVAAAIPIVVLIAAGAAELTPLEGNARAVTVVLIPAYYLTLATWFFIRWLDYYLDVGIVTNQRIIDIDQAGLFRRNIAELDNKMVQDISADKSGVLQTLFDFGNLVVQTAGERPNFTFKGIPHPELVVDKIQESISDKGDPVDKVAEAADQIKEAAQEMGSQSESAEPNKQQENIVQDKAESAAEKVRDKVTGESDDSQDLPRDYSG